MSGTGAAVTRATCLALVLAGGATACVGQPARTPGQIALQPLYQARDCGRREESPAVTLLTDGAAFAALWRRVSTLQLPSPAMPAVDFSRARVAVIESGRRPDAARGLELADRGARLDGTILHVPARVVDAGGGTIVAQVLTSPCLVLSFEAPAASVVEALGVDSGKPAAPPPAPR